MLGHHARLLADLQTLVRDEQTAGQRQLVDTWARPLPEKLRGGWTQGFVRLAPGDDGQSLWAWPDDGESRFREGDLLALHAGRPLDALLGRQLMFELEEDARWLLRGHAVKAVLESWDGGTCYADPDAMDLTGYYEQALEDIATGEIGRDVLLPLLAGELALDFDDRDVSEGQRVARAEGCNVPQALAVGMAHGADRIACIQGPPGTGKTRVLALIVRLRVARGERVLLTSHTHTAINNALNQIHAQGVPTRKIGRATQCKGLDPEIPCLDGIDDWADRPTDGYVIGATPFATCSRRLRHVEFDTVVFDEASQVTVPLALMAMRKGRRYLFIGDECQLPPVLLSRSVLGAGSGSVFEALTAQRADHTVMLTETYRMNRWLAAWPSAAYYGGRLVATGANRERALVLPRPPTRHAAVFDAAAHGVFVPTLDRTAQTRNLRDAERVVDWCAVAVESGLALEQIGIVAPFRAQGRAIRNLLVRRFGRDAARQVVADTVERMQGQERDIVIVSLAAGDPAYVATMAGFLFQPERLNVAITRPRTRLILIGPAIDEVPVLEDARLRRWIGAYIDLTRHLVRVDG